MALATTIERRRDRDRALSSGELHELLGITYRQLDYLCRRGVIAGQVSPGSGRHRSFPPEVVDRLVVARHIQRAMPLGSMAGSAVWPSIVEAVMAAGDPPTEGFVTMNADGLVRYADELSLEDVEIGTLVVPYRLD